MPLSDIVTEIVSLLGSIDGIGKVLDYSRYTASEKERNDTYVANGVLNCWIVSRSATAARDRGMGPKNIRSQHTILIEGFRAVTSAADSEKLHQDLAEKVRGKLHDNRKLNGKGWLSSPVSVVQFAAAMFMGAVLCWYVKLQVTAEDTLQGG